MARHTVQAYGLQLSRLRKKELMNFGNIDNSKVDFLDLAAKALGDLGDNPVRKVDRFTRLDDVGVQGRTIRYWTATGRYGAEGDIIDVATGQKVGLMESGHAALTPLRNLLVVPLHGEVAVLLTERHATAGSATVVRSRLRHWVAERFDDIRLDVEALADGAAWNRALERAKLEAITAVRYSEQDRADGVRPLRTGILRVQRAGYRGRFLPQDLLGKAIAGDVPVNELVGVDMPLDDAEVHVTIQHGQGSKTFVVGREKMPTLSYVLVPDEDERPDDDDFFKYVSDLAPTLLQQMGCDLPPDWAGGAG